MTVALTDSLIAALSLPDSCRVDQRVPKKMLVDNGARSSSDKRLINDAVEEIKWLAAIKPNTVGVAEYRDDSREYLEVAVICITVHGEHADGNEGDARSAGRVRPVNIRRLAELVHRAVPYPVFLLLATPKGLFLSLVHKRWAQNEAGKVVLDGEMVNADLTDLTDAAAFMQALALDRQPQASLLTLYEAWINCLIAWQASRYTGAFAIPDCPAKAAVRIEALRICKRLEQESVRLRALAAKEKQLARQVELNLALKRLSAELASARTQL